MWIFVEPCRIVIWVYLDILVPPPPPNSKFLSPPLETCTWISMHIIELSILMHLVKSHYICIFTVAPYFIQSNIFDNNHMLTKFKNMFRYTWIIQYTFVLPFIMRHVNSHWASVFTTILWLAHSYSTTKYLYAKKWQEHIIMSTWTIMHTFVLHSISLLLLH